MSGGLGRVRVDRCEDFMEERKKRYGIELVPLPNNLKLPELDQEFNRRLNPRLNAGAI
jgi:hypothetical protein